MIILAIETSCDDTCIAILKIKNQKSKVKSFEVLSNVVSSQVKVHRKYGGVYPFLAKREHQKNLPLVLQKALKGAKLLLGKIDLIAVTVGPGLEPCLWVGVNFAKNLAKKLKIPIVPVNHIEAHIAANFIGRNSKFNQDPFSISWVAPSRPFEKGRTGEQILNSKNLFPAICLIVSGGHTQLILMKEFRKYKILGETRDDAAGECLDKVARILGLGYPGGPAIAKESAKLKESSFGKFQATADFLPNLQKLPRPMIYQKNYDFSFSGLKTAVLYKARDMRPEETKRREFVQQMCQEVQQAIIDVLIYKTLRAAKEYRVKTIMLGGGVAANEELRKQLKLKIVNCKLKINFLVPPKNLCTDNAAMVAIAAYFRWLKRKDWKKIEANANLGII